MPQTIWGKLSFVTLILLAIEAGWVYILIFENFLEAMRIIIQFTPFLAPLGLLFGVVGIIKENYEEKLIPGLTLLLSLILIAMYLSILLGTQYIFWQLNNSN